MRPPRGTALLVALLLMYLVVLYGREVFREKNLPAICVTEHSEISVLLGDGFPVQGIHQFSDGISLVSVIKMADTTGAHRVFSGGLPDRAVEDGSLLSLVIKDNEIIEVNQGWMPAVQRMACGIALHPDRMSLADWESLPGIGPHLAAAIENDRQKNGDFGTLEALQRVRGIGQKSIRRWQEFF